MNACRAQSCEQGRKTCPCPSACQWDEDDSPTSGHRALSTLSWILVVVILGGVGAAFFWI